MNFLKKIVAKVKSIFKPASADFVAPAPVAEAPPKKRGRKPTVKATKPVSTRKKKV